jgi:hypothetical protein
VCWCWGVDVGLSEEKKEETERTGANNDVHGVASSEQEQSFKDKKEKNGD